MKQDFKRIVHEAYLSKMNIITRRENVPAVLKRVLEKPKYVSLAKNGFQKCGIFPLDGAPLMQEAIDSFQTRLPNLNTYFQNVEKRIA